MKYQGKRGEAAAFPLAGMQTACGGTGRCGKCRIRLLEGTLPVSRAEAALLTKEELRAGLRLACCHERWENDCRFEVVAPEEGFRISGCATASFGPGQEEGYALAADIGTTTVVLELVDLRQGRIVKEYTFLNPQRAFGADVISRLAAAGRVGTAPLQEVLWKEMEAAIATIQEGLAGPIRRMTICGNPTMTHLFMGVDPAPLAAAPFCCPVTEYREISLPPFPFPVQVLAPVSAYIGSDVVMDLYELLQKESGDFLLLDLGTNGEMALRRGGRISCAGAACGPAFEGGNLSCGQGACEGAIDAFFYEKGWRYHTIGEKEATGICGSGYLSLLAQAVEQSHIDPGGYMEKELIFHTNAKLTQKDVREFQLAKSAVAAALVCLCRSQGVEPREIDAVYLAGGFGTHVREEDLFTLGILPTGLRGKVKAVGNSAVSGCARYAVCQDKEYVSALIANCQSLQLAGNTSFAEEFIKHLEFTKM